MSMTQLDHSKQREFSMTSANFQKIKVLAYRLTGIHLSELKENMIYGRLARRLRALNLDDFNQYCDIIDTDHCAEHAEFINSITTNLTAFFRENHHFDFLRQQLLPQLIEKNKVSKKIRIWSAGCSTGEEPYSIAMVVATFPALKSWDVKILATDLDTNVVAKGSAGVYAHERGEPVPKEYQRFLQIDKSGESLKIKDEVRQLISFKPLNLLHEWPLSGQFDFIFCRNVVIYFDLPTQKKLFDRYANQLTETGHLFIGHSENLHKISDRFNSLGRTIYQRIK